MFKTHRILEAAKFAAIAHGDQKRKYTGEPYIAHPISVAQMVLASVPSETDAVVAAILHDVLEDTKASPGDIASLFGPDVLQLVIEVTDVSKRHDGNRAARKAMDREHIGRASWLGKTIKLADLIDNGHSIFTHDKDFAKVYLAELTALLPLVRGGHTGLFKQAEAMLNEYELARLKAN